MTKSRALAEKHSLTCFLNSLLLECPRATVSEGQREVLFNLGDSERLRIPLEKFSLLGRHHYGLGYFLEKDNHLSQVSFQTLVEKIMGALKIELGLEASHLEDFLDRLSDSVSNIESALELRAGERDHFFRDLDFIAAEAALLIGHAFHPIPKGRGEFNHEDFLRYSPEARPKFQLSWFSIHEDLLGQKSSLDEMDHWTRRLFKARPLPEKHVPFPVHPWQKKFLLRNVSVQAYLQDGRILDLGDSGALWKPTSSLRTLYSETSPYMIKFSLNVKLTNSVRHLFVHELDRGLQVHRVFTHPVAESFLKETPEFEVIFEPAYAGLKDQSGDLIRESLIMGRLNPFKESTGALVLATLTQDHPWGGTNLINSYVDSLAVKTQRSARDAAQMWFGAFLKVALAPLLKAQGNLGILLGAHQQNMLLKIEDDLPVKSYFRDCHGTGYSELGFRLFSKDVPEMTRENGNILEESAASYLFGYYVIINSVFNVISAIAHGGHVEEEELLKHLRTFLEDLKSQGMTDESFLDYLLGSPFLMHKGNFLCSFKRINENTQSNPLAIYTKIPNPLSGVTHA